MRSASKLLVLVLAIALSVGMVVTTAVPVAADSPTQTITLLSGGTTQTAGYTCGNPGYEVDTYVSGSSTSTVGVTNINPSADPLNASSYSYGGNWSPAQIPNNNPSPWTTIAGANWVSTTSLNYGVETANESDAWRLFRATFCVSDAAKITAVSIQIAADNAYEFYLNDSKIDSTENWTTGATVYGSAPGSGGSTDPFQKVVTYTLTLQSGTNTLMFVVRNWDNSGQANPTGLIYKLTIEYSKEAQLTASSYSGSWANAVPITTLPDPWVKPDWGAKWVSTTADFSGADNDYKGDAWRLFKDEFNIPAGATINSASIQLTADNTFEVYSNGVQIASTLPSDTVYGAAPSNPPWPRTPPYPFQSANGPYDFTNSATAGTNTLMFVVRNWDSGNNSNPTGLIYKAVIQYALDTQAPVVTITSPADNGIYKSGTVPAAGYSAVDNYDSNPTVVVTGYGTEEGIHTMIVTATDATGNTSTASITYLVDNTPPDILINYPADQAIYKLGTMPTVPDIIVSDELDANASYTCTGYDTGLGTHTVTVTAVDAASNTSTASVIYQVQKNPKTTSDKTGPVITIISPKAKTYYTYQTLKIFFGVKDKDSGVATKQATLDGTVVKNCQKIDLSNMVGSHTFTVTATDKVGNSSTKTVTFNVQVGVLKARIKIMPDTINLKSKSDKNAITAIIDLPYGRGENQIDVSTVKLNINGTSISAKLPGPKEKSCAFIVKFDRQQVISALTGLSAKFPFKVIVTVTGALKDGTQFSGKDTITVISQGNKNNNH